METTTLSIIKDSFEFWYKKKYSEGNPMSIVINYSDEQKLSIKAYHTVTIQMNAVGIKDGESYTKQLIYIQENYNHGVTSEQEAKNELTMKLLDRLYGYSN